VRLLRGFPLQPHAMGDGGACADGNGSHNGWAPGQTPASEPDC
jgi:hypothetical protein